MSESNENDLVVGKSVCEAMAKDAGERMALFHLQLILEKASAALLEGQCDMVDKYIGSAISITHALRERVVTDDVRRDIGAGFH